MHGQQNVKNSSVYVFTLNTSKNYISSYLTSCGIFMHSFFTPVNAKYPFMLINLDIIFLNVPA